MRVEYIYDTFQLALDASVNPSGAIPHLPARRKYLVNKGSGGGLSLKRPHMIDSEEEATPRKRRKGSPNWEGEKGELPDVELYPDDVNFHEIPKLCVLRGSPVVCVNQDIVGTLAWEIIFPNDWRLFTPRSTRSSLSMRTESLRSFSRRTRTC
jgi:hypothetical protein